jgi:hypothetical protein
MQALRTPLVDLLHVKLLLQIRLEEQRKQPVPLQTPRVGLVRLKMKRPRAGSHPKQFHPLDLGLQPLWRHLDKVYTNNVTFAVHFSEPW